MYQYLLKPTKPYSKAHIWSPERGHTLCRMSQTQGFRMQEYKITTELDEHPLCWFCINVTAEPDEEE